MWGRNFLNKKILVIFETKGKIANTKVDFEKYLGGNIIYENL